jgi:hypothetical protein
MKQFMVLASGLILAVAQIAIAGDKPNPPATTQATARPASSNRPVAAVRTGHNRIAAQPNGNVRRNYPAVTQPIHRSRLTASGQERFTNYQIRQTRDRSHQREREQVKNEPSQAANNNRPSYFDALRRHRHERHDCNWWRQHYPIIVFVSTGYYFWDAGYWYPAWGYDPLYDYYDYDGPIYTYGDLLPDQVIANVQCALQEEGYYSGPVTGSLSVATRAAIANYQRDHDLIVTGAIDAPTIESLGLD